ncbi:TPM domain-containing protein [Flavobacterium urocaniciphilum]|uniref:TLP18.3, Psb32 and MOLO-1 founding protein of phosphatase n=1 Tax=Flavobacterium urocaniciphilum TaxID=1299341 RepID=A0A1H9ASL6_9FLAO|nr:TPM domain-containing protein [Flavobacterium urocaniciphilum]SEP79649.1 TLP18.3, Psb32 and MOLO-1 founding protein of phosphatase [Flavobacterium urocaniciphilum]
MSKTEDFLTKAEEQEIVQAIVEAEKNTSGEIRVHIEENNTKPPVERAQEVFHILKMDATELKNGVLFYICMQTKSFAIIGDQGIDKLVEDDFWDCTKDLVISHFKKGEFKLGLINGILRAGERLKKYFPYDHENDTNELSNEISRN